MLKETKFIIIPQNSSHSKTKFNLKSFNYHIPTFFSKKHIIF